MRLQEKIQCQDGGVQLVRIGPGEGSLSEGKEILRFRDNEGYERYVPLPAAFFYLEVGDVLRVNLGAGEIRVLYRRNSPHNVLFFTERCNSRCLMCSQPPRAIDDGYLIDEILALLPLISPETRELCITGGEPTLLGERFLEVLRALKFHLPETSIHVLTNGRNFESPFLAKAVADVQNSDLMLGIPLYADVAWKHDFIVQSKGAFDQTVRGIQNLGRAGVPLEIRFVIHKQSYDRLPQTARFIARHFPFVKQVALMGLEMMGFAKSNVEALWIEPRAYAQQLSSAVDELRFGRILPRIYNHQLCLLPKHLWPFTCKSISDWKNIYAEECHECDIREQCGGFFASSEFRRSHEIQPIKMSIVGSAEHPLEKIG
jgi:His-Xaa-Ser system radical SAM maturase HxsC